MHILDEELYQAGMALAACPTAPGHEHWVQTCLQNLLIGLPHLSLNWDEFGNLLVRYDCASTGRTPFRLVAHMDHPAFHVISLPGGKREVHFLGGVEADYLLGKTVTFHSHDSLEPLGQGVISQVDFPRVSFEEEIPVPARFGTWTLPPATCTKGPDSLFVSPACDDLAQVATMVALLRRLALNNAPARVEALFTRAEETGFYGALMALEAREKLTPMITLSLETSKAQGYAQVGEGPIVRVGDRSSVFDSQVTQWLDHSFVALQKVEEKTKYQRLLMGGGTCEGTVFHRAGFPTGALCLALNNYHNRGEENAIVSESISLQDWQGLYDFLYFLATAAPSPQDVQTQIDDKFAGLRASARLALSPDNL